ncbi:MAG: urea amidolyase associated protein UAAP1 [Arenicellales bacterium]
MSETDPSPRAYRERYIALRSKARAANARRAPARQVENPRVIPTDLIAFEESIPGGRYWTARLAKGLSLRLVNLEGVGSLATLLWSARDPVERVNPADTLKVQWTARIGRGKILLSDMGRAMASITDDTCGLHDCLTGASTRASDTAKYGPEPALRNSEENLRLAAAKHGLGPRDVGPCISFFAPVVTDDAGRFGWQRDAVEPGAYVDLRAEMDLLVALSNCPHPLDPSPTWRAAPMRVIAWHSPEPRPDDACRTGTEEGVRAFENNAALAAQGGL